jgi:hypothetical protein
MLNEKSNSHSVIFIANAIVCLLASILLLYTFSYEGNMDNLSVFFRLLLILVLIINSFISFNINIKNINVIRICSFIFFIISFFYALHDIMALGIIKYVDIISEMFLYGYFLPYASIVFGIWNLLVFIFSRSFLYIK